MQIGIFARTFARPTLEGVLDAVVEHGLHCVQFNMACAGLPSMPDSIGSEVIGDIREAMQSRGIVMAAVSGTFNMIHPYKKEREMGLRRLRVLAGACKGMGTGVITLCTGTRDAENMWRWHAENESAGAWEDLLRSMEVALRIAEEEDVTLAFEPEQANVVNTAAKGRLLLDALRSRRLKVVMDPANLIGAGDVGRQGQIMEEAFALLGGEIVVAHAKDRGADGAFRAAGEGVLDYGRYVGLLKGVGYEGAVILHGLREEEVSGAVKFLREKL